MKLKTYKYAFNAKTNTPTLRHCIAGVCIKKQTFVRPEYVQPEPGTPKEVLIVKTDSIGDYFLMRNFWESLRRSEKFRDARITLIVTSAIRDIPEYLDAANVERVFYVPHPFWLRNDAEKFRLLDDMFRDGLKRRYDAILFPNFNVRNFLFFNIMLVNSIAAGETVATTGDIDPGDRPWISLFHHFTRVVPAYHGHDTFEFENNRRFFEETIEEKIPMRLPTIDLPKTPRSICVINPCAQDDLRRWHPVNYAHFIDAMRSRGLSVTLIGAKNDRELLDKVNKLCNGACKVVAGASWPETIRLINDAALFVGNDSGCFHLAAALGVRSICVSGGMSWQRFVNYPKASHIRIVTDRQTLDRLSEMLSEPCYRTRSLDFTGNVNTVPVHLVVEAANSLLEGADK